jgi:predicted transcriptional regulator of viral defense system
MKRDDLIQKTNALGKDIFTTHDLRQLFPNETNLKMAIKRLIDSGVVSSIAKGIYIQKDKTIDLEQLATQLYYPSYLSFETVLSKHGVINQGYNKLTLATTRHSKKILIANIECEYIQIKPLLFFGFNLISGTYIAEPEKAILDELYLISLGKRKINYSEWTLDNLNKKAINKYLNYYPSKVHQIASSLLK